MLSRRAASLSIIGAILRRRAKISGDFDDEYRGRTRVGRNGRGSHLLEQGLERGLLRRRSRKEKKETAVSDGETAVSVCGLLCYVELLRIILRRRLGRPSE
jgi:hypothetical protein